MQTKTEQAIQLWNNGDEVKALSLFSKFKLGFTKEERAVLSIAYEMNTVGHELYVKLGYCKRDQMARARAIINDKYLKNEQV